MAKELLFSINKKDLKITCYCAASGPGGQNVNKVASAVRIEHLESGAVAQSKSERDQHLNKKLAFKRLMEDPKMKIWINKRVHEVISGETIKQRVDKMMTPNNLKIEVKDEKEDWITISI